jgi:23S rRNA (pseudouridine1915-N3)-methyltransferase
MRIVIAAVGRLKAEERALYDRYAERIDQTGRRVALGPLTLIEIPESRAAGPAERTADEAQKLLKATAEADLRIALDEHGKQLTSQAFSADLGRRRDGGVRSLAFLVGGADGHHETVRSAAALTLSLGPMTLPHGLARIVLVEQLYRAVTILAGHPYHRA